MQGKSRELKIKADKFNRIENALEIWYDQTPILEKIEMTFFENREQFLLHSLQNNPQNIIFDYNDPFINEIKKDEKTYNKILNLIKEEIQKGNLKGEIITGGTPETEINFKNPDLATSIHGIKKIQYEAIEKNGDFEVDIKLIDIYDFDRKRHTGLKSFFVYLADKSEEIDVIKNYEITIKIKENLSLSK